MLLHVLHDKCFVCRVQSLPGCSILWLYLDFVERQANQIMALTSLPSRDLAVLMGTDSDAPGGSVGSFCELRDQRGRLTFGQESGRAKNGLGKMDDCPSKPQRSCTLLRRRGSEARGIYLSLSGSFELQIIFLWRA